jgi:hypothetical protein
MSDGQNRQHRYDRNKRAQQKLRIGQLEVNQVEHLRHVCRRVSFLANLGQMC